MPGVAIAMDKRMLWLAAARDSGVWWRAVKIGLPVGLLQVSINQGDVWLSHAVTPVVVLKTAVSPMIGVALAWFSAAATFVKERQSIRLKE